MRSSARAKSTVTNWPVKMFGLSTPASGTSGGPAVISTTCTETPPTETSRTLVTNPSTGSPPAGLPIRIGRCSGKPQARARATSIIEPSAPVSKTQGSGVLPPMLTCTAGRGPERSSGMTCSCIVSVEAHPATSGTASDRTSAGTIPMFISMSPAISSVSTIGASLLQQYCSIVAAPARPLREEIWTAPTIPTGAGERCERPTLANLSCSRA